MIDIPDMPTDWWPDMVIVRGTVTAADDRQLELAFAMSAMDANYPAIWQANLETFRLALWQAMHDPKLAEERCA